MKDPNEHMDDSVRNKFQEHEVPVPDHLWKSVSSRLPAEPEATGTSFWSSSISKLFLITAGVLSLIGGTLYLSQPDSVNLSGTSTPGSTDAVIQTTETHTINTDHSAHTASSYTHVVNPDEQKGSTSGNVQTVTTNTIHTDISHLSGNKNGIGNNTSRYRQTAAATIAGTHNRYIPVTNRQRVGDNKQTAEHTSQHPNTDIHATGQHINTSTGIADQQGNSYLNTDNGTNPDTSVYNVPASWTSIQNNLSKSISSIHSDSASNLLIHAASDVLKGNVTETAGTDSLIQTEKTHTGTLYSKKQIVESGSASDSILASGNASNTYLNHQVIHKADSGNVYTQAESLGGAASSVTHTEESFKPNDIPADTTFLRSSSANTLQSDSISQAGQGESRMLTDLSHTDSTVIALDSITGADTNPSKVIDTSATRVKEEHKQAVLQHISFDVYGAPLLTHVYTHPNHSTETEQSFIQNKNTPTGTGFSIGMRMNYSVSRKVEIGTGIQYSSSALKTALTETVQDSAYSYTGHFQTDSVYDAVKDTTFLYTHYVLTDSSKNSHSSITKAVDSYQAISIPFFISYGYALNARWTIRMRYAMQFTYNVHTTTYLNYTADSYTAYHSTKKASVSGSLSIGLYYSVTRTMSAFAEPVLLYQWDDVFGKAYFFKQTMLSAGLQIGVRYHF